MKIEGIRRILMDQEPRDDVKQPMRESRVGRSLEGGGSWGDHRRSRHGRGGEEQPPDRREDLSPGRTAHLEPVGMAPWDASERTSRDEGRPRNPE